MIGSVAPDELLARYIMSSRWFRGQNLTVKPDAFIPSDSELSVTRHLHPTEKDIWKIGRRIAKGMSTLRNLYGRADIETRHVLAQRLNVVPQPAENGSNPNHANIINWPSDKNARKMCALEIAMSAHFVVNPERKI